MAVSFKEFDPADISQERSYLETLIDVIQEDISGSATRKTMQMWVTGTAGSPGVTSSLFQTVYDQDFTLQQANAILDMTVGLASASTTVQDTVTSVDSFGKMLFPSSSLMMREKVDIYRQYAQTLLGNSDSQFFAPFDSTTTADRIDDALFLSVKRLFSRDGTKPATTAIVFYESASLASVATETPNLHTTSELGRAVYHDLGATQNTMQSPGGTVVSLKDAANSNRVVGLSFLEQGTIVLNLNLVISGTQFCSGTIDAVGNAAGTIDLGGPGTGHPETSKFIPDFITSASIDDIVDHFASCRFSSGSLSAMTFTNQTVINSSLYFVRLLSDEFNYSSNPTYINVANDRIRTVQPGQENNQTAETFLTTVGLYSPDNELLAVAKLSRPVQKSPSNELVFRIRLDY